MEIIVTSRLLELAKDTMDKFCFHLDNCSYHMTEICDCGKTAHFWAYREELEKIKGDNTINLKSKEELIEHWNKGVSYIKAKLPDSEAAKQAKPLDERAVNAAYRIHKVFTEHCSPDEITFPKNWTHIQMLMMIGAIEAAYEDKK